MAGLTLDSGALLAFGRDDRRVTAHLKEAALRGAEVTIPVVVVTEVWRGGSRSARIARLLAASVVEPMDEPLARIAGEALARVASAGAIDAIVMTSAARRRDAVLTSDRGDLDRLAACFRGVRVIAI